MTDYETFVKYLHIKRIIHTSSRLYRQTYELFYKKEELSDKIFKELEEGSLSPNSPAGEDFHWQFRKYVKSSHTVNEFVLRLQEDFPRVQEELNKILERRGDLKAKLQ